MNTILRNKVMIVDDDRDFLRLLQRHLERDCYQVVAADSGCRALQMIQDEQPAFAVLDLDMPGMDGLELCRRLRQLELPHYLYIVFLTGSADEDALQKAMDAGADDFLRKPLHRMELLARLKAGARVLTLESHLSQMAAEDSLTGLLLRRPFGEYLSKEWRRSQRYRLPLSVAMIDIDYFKQINDIHGHAAGDEAIRRVAELIRSNTRDSDVVCRYGGEEFAVLLPETDEVSAAAWAERLRRRIADTSHAFDAEKFQVTVSVGVAGLYADMEDGNELVRMADECLLTAKQWGRNCVYTLRKLIEAGHLLVEYQEKNNLLDGILARHAMIPLSHGVRDDWPIDRVAAYFLQYRISSAPVTDRQGGLLGIVSEKDVLAIAHSIQSSLPHVGDIMRTNVVSFCNQTPLLKILRFMTRATMRSVVITDGDLPCGMITRSSLVRWFLENHWNEKDVLPKNVQAEFNSDGFSQGESPLLLMAANLVEEAKRLQQDLQTDRHGDRSAPIVGGTTRMQQLLDDMLAGSASASRTGGGVPF